MIRVAMLSVHTCPLAALGGKQTGGMNVYVRELARELARMGVAVDVFTRSQNPAIPRVVELGEGARVIHVPAGPEAPLPRVRVHEHLEEFEEGCCPSCGEELVDEEATRPVCWGCAARLERELAAYLEFVAVSREPA